MVHTFLQYETVFRSNSVSQQEHTQQTQIAQDWFDVSYGVAQWYICLQWQHH